MDSKIKTKGDFSRVTDEERDFINKVLDKFQKKHAKDFSEMHIKLDCNLHKETSRGRAAHYCRINVSTDKGLFVAEDQEFTAEKAISASLQKIERQIIKKKTK